MKIRLAVSDKEIAACYPVMSELRPHLAADEFVVRIRRQEQSGYRMAFLGNEGEPQAVAGFRIGENLAWGRFLYVDDLVTLPQHRSKGLGAAMLAWLREYARSEGCGQLHLDSGMQRQEAHRFYEREGMSRAGYHFAENVVTDEE